MRAVSGDRWRRRRSRSWPVRSGRQPAPGPSSPKGISRPLMRRIQGHLERQRALARLSKADQRRNAEHQHDGDRDRVRARQPCHSAPAREYHEDHGGDRDVDGAGRGTEPRMKRGEPARQRPVGRGSVEHAARRRPKRHEPPEAARTSRRLRERAPSDLEPTPARPSVVRDRPKERLSTASVRIAGTSRTTRNVPKRCHRRMRTRASEDPCAATRARVAAGIHSQRAPAPSPPPTTGSVSANPSR